jgi:hypothetical protein
MHVGSNIIWCSNMCFGLVDINQSGIQWNLGSRTPLVTNKLVHEQIIQTKNVSGDERCLE